MLTTSPLAPTAGESGRSELPLAGQRRYPQAGQVIGETEPFAEAGLALARVAGSEGESDLGHPQLAPGHRLEQDLEPQRSQGVHLQGRRPDGEEPAHRVSDLPQAAREGGLGDLGSQPGHTGPRAVGKPARRAVVGVATGDHQVRLVQVDRADEVRDGLRRMLEVTVHHHHDPAFGQSHPGHHRPTEATHTLTGTPVHDQHRQRGTLTCGGGHLRGVVSTVVDEDQLGPPGGEHGAELVDQRSDVGALVTSRHHHTDIYRLHLAPPMSSAPPAYPWQRIRSLTGAH